MKGGTEVKDDTEDLSNVKHSSPVAGHEEEGVAAESVSSDHEEENSAKATEEPPVGAVDPEVEESGGDNISTTEDLDVKTDEVSLSGIYSLPGEAEEEEADEEEPPDLDVSYRRCTRLLQELHEERDKATEHSGRLQAKLAEHLSKKARDDARLGRRVQVPEQHQEYEKYINVLADLKLRLAADSETAEQQAEELRLQAQQKLDEVENEWQALMALKQDVAVTVLSRRLGKQAAQAKVESALAAEQLRQDQLINLRLKHIKLMLKIHRLEAELRDENENSRDPLQLQFKKLQAERLEQKKHAEKQREESVKLQAKISSSLELLSNVKEKLYWSQMQVQAKREQLAEVEARVAEKRDLLTRTKQARNSLQRDNQKLKERRGLLGNRVLLHDFQKTVDASDKLEEQLENLKCRQAETVFSRGRWKKPSTV